MDFKQRQRAWSGSVAVIIAAVAFMSTAHSEAYADASPAHAAAAASPEVTHSGIAPTGYTVTFRIYDPTATRMRIKGEWSFASAAEIAADPTNSTPSYGYNWQPGEFPLATPNAGSAANWPVVDMVKDSATGVWSYTTPLPSGVFNYAFYRNCDAATPALTGCTPTSDPSNPPWNSSGSLELTSQVYVPSDSSFGTTDYSWQGPTPRDDQGSLSHVSYSSPGHVNPTDQNYLSVYTPPGYDPQRAQAYPTFYLVHGGGGNEMDWSTQGDLKNIMDNLIAKHEIQPMVVVMPNNPTTGEMLDDIIPFVQNNYHVDATASGRSFAGLSGGATVVQDILYHDTTTFGYYAVWSAPRGIPTAGEQNNPELKQLLGLHIGVAVQDLGGLAQGNTTAEQALLTSAGVPFVSYNVNGGHNWAFWRNALRNFLTRVAFRATSVAVSNDGRSVTATVTSATTEPAVPTGTVQFSFNSAPLGQPVAVKKGKAHVAIPASLGHGVVAASYSGDNVFNLSSGGGTL